MLYPKDKNDRRFSMAFQLKSNRKETENKTIRFPLPLIEEIEKAKLNSLTDEKVFYKILSGK